MPYKFTEQEKEEIRQQYLANMEAINNNLPDGLKLKVDLSGLNKKLNDPRQAWIYKKALELNAREVKKKEIQDQLSQKFADLKIPGKDYELDRAMHTDLIPSDDPEAMAYNEELYKQYLLHPEAMVQYRFQKVLDSKNDDIGKMAQCKDLESLMLLYSEKNPTFVEDSCSMVSVFARESYKRLLTPEMKEFYRPVCGNYENIIDSSNIFKKMNTGYFTVPKSLTQAQDYAINGGNFATEHHALYRLLTENMANNVAGDTQVKDFAKFFKWCKDNNVDLSKPGALSGSVIYTGAADNKPVSMSNFVSNPSLYKGLNAVKVDLPPQTVEGIKKIFVEDFTKEPGFKVPEIPSKFKEPSWKLSRDELVFKYAIKYDVPVHEIDNGGFSKIAEKISGNLKERVFNTTSLEYKNLITAMKNYDNENHVGYHNSMPVKIAANQYLLHKGITSREQAERLTNPAKDRTLLCFDLIETFQKNEGPDIPKIVPGTQQQVEVNHNIERVQAIEDPKLVDDFYDISIDNDMNAKSFEIDNEIDLSNDK